MPSAKDVRQLTRRLRAQGFEIRRTSKGHLAVYQCGGFITILASTPSDPRALKNGIATLKRAGYRP